MRTQNGETGDSIREDSRALADEQAAEVQPPPDEEGGGMVILDDLGQIASLQRASAGLPRLARSFPLNQRFAGLWEIPDSALQRMLIENDLRRALDRGEFDVYLQPQADVRTGVILGVEALARWQHPQRGLVLPEEFIPPAEQLGLISQLDGQVLRMACRQSRAREDAGLPSLRLAVNLSAPQFQDPHLVETIAAALDECRLPPHSLEVEITETVAMKNAAFAIEVLTDLRALGVDIALDDFGTGYSSLQYL
ncbi:MAG: EAL domain-containing protein, partial [Dehalococcoidia bacterium]